ncbi:Disease resistance protein RFL1, putative [Ricinus communis]|uniref:Disease resistance protein RFL1, putative n=1 Tax=Ricinus communis TaxID=3988 RepID=B9RV03_RICCO|nr:Disease resistance protein RFL1, putative [Ricinus communis]|eukprot:XP_025012823.1 probable disease resistance protein At5g63020 isoform X1 [Ricinus communis]
MGSVLSISISISPIDLVGWWKLLTGRANRVEGRPSEPTVGLDTMLHKVWNCLMKEDVGIVGLYGMGGIGKTTVLTQINNKFLNRSHGFDVIWITVSKDLRLEKIQEEIGEKLGFSDDQKWKKRILDEKAIDIYNVLRKKKFLLLLDDIWERVNLIRLGIPRPDGKNRSKVVFTTRSEMVCSQMDAHKKIKVETLAWTEAWKLFQDKVGEDNLNIHPDIPHLAQAVARECDGLPIALITIARAMACKKTPQEWNHALEVLRKSASELQGMSEEVFALLKFSYDSLPNKRLQSCFLYCALFPEDFKIDKDDLIDYWNCDVIWNHHDGGSTPSSEGSNSRSTLLLAHLLKDETYCARNEGYEIIGTLVRACLLEEEGKYVKVHDVIRDMALWIASNCAEEKEQFLVQAGVQLSKAPKIEKWEGVNRVSLMANSFYDLPEKPVCANLLTLFLCHNPDLRMITSEFFQFMDALTVLDLSKTGIMELPLGISKLVSLQYLNLSDTSLTQLSVELSRLKKLKYLNLERNGRLKMIPGQVLSNLSALQVLRMLRCGSHLYEKAKDNLLADGKLQIEELQSLENLNELSITINFSSILQSFFNMDRFLNCTRALLLMCFDAPRSVDISFLANMKNLGILEILANSSLEVLDVGILTQGTSQVPSVISSKKCFDSLQRVVVYNCRKLRELTWLSLAPNLAILRVKYNENMEEIFSVRILIEFAIRGSINLKPLAKLEFLELGKLPRLESVHPNALSFPFLKKIKVFKCPKLKKLPLNSSSVKGSEVVIEAEAKWWEDVEWEDDATKAAFLPHFTHYTTRQRM